MIVSLRLKKTFIGLKAMVRDSYWYRFLKLRIYGGVILKYRVRRNLDNSNQSQILTVDTKKKILIPLIETSHYQFYQILLIAKALELRGADVRILLCDSLLPGCEIKSSRNTKVNPCLDCSMNKNLIVPEFDLKTINLSEIVSEDKVRELEDLADSLLSNYPAYYERFGVDIIRMVNDSVIRYFYGAVPDSDSEEIKRVQKKFLVSALIGCETSQKLHSLWAPDVVFGSMEVYADWAPYHQYFRNCGVRTSTVSISQFNYNGLLLNQNDLFRSNVRYTIWLNARQNRCLDEQETSQINNFIESRFRGDDKAFVGYGYFDKGQSSIELLDIDPEKHNIFLFSNVYWDVGMSEFSCLYAGVLEWVISTIYLIMDSPTTHLYIKPHPSEVFDIKSAKGVIDEIYYHFPVLPENITIVRPEMKILTYELFPYIDVGVVYNGTLGLEMLFHDIPVIACGKTPYGGINLVAEPDSEDSYVELLLGKTDIVKPSKSQVSQFAYFYFIKTLIPWNFTKTAYGDVFPGFNMKNITEIMPNSDYYLDHICNSIVSSNDDFMDSWVSPT